MVYSFYLEVIIGLTKWIPIITDTFFFFVKLSFSFEFVWPETKARHFRPKCRLFVLVLFIRSLLKCDVIWAIQAHSRAKALALFFEIQAESFFIIRPPQLACLAQFRSIRSNAFATFVSTLVRMHHDTAQTSDMPAQFGCQ